MLLSSNVNVIVIAVKHIVLLLLLKLSLLFHCKCHNSIYYYFKHHLEHLFLSSLPINYANNCNEVHFYQVGKFNLIVIHNDKDDSNDKNNANISINNNNTLIIIQRYR